MVLCRRTSRNPISAHMGFENWERGAHLEDAEVQELLRKLVENSRLLHFRLLGILKIKGNGILELKVWMLIEPGFGYSLPTHSARLAGGIGRCEIESFLDKSQQICAILWPPCGATNFG